MQHDFGIIPRKLFSFLKTVFSENNVHDAAELIPRITFLFP